ncbi:hypothetical protein V5O48_018606 [Marasmius crinis-equi]|uniref:BTB domain-containing protein n=1 Tax=Marasmius crinis-equi TaxID=585013 RepID=A0ABR3EKS6_9AGAR
MQLPDFERHPKYRFEDANVSFIVEDRIRFDVHRHFLQRDSEFFKRMLSGRPNAPDGTYYVPGVKIHQFESLLDFFYDGMYFISPTKIPIEYWINLLCVSTTFGFFRAREHAIAAIDLCQSSQSSNMINPARIIEIANLCGVEKWLKSAYAVLIEREEMVSEEEAEMVGMKGLLVIMRAREARLRERILGMKGKDEKESFGCSDKQEGVRLDDDGEGAGLRETMSPVSPVPSSTFADLATPSLTTPVAPSFAPSRASSRLTSRAPTPASSRAPSPAPSPSFRSLFPPGVYKTAPQGDTICRVADVNVNGARLDNTATEIARDSEQDIPFIPKAADRE